MGRTSTLIVAALVTTSGCDSTQPAVPDAAADGARDAGIDVDPNFDVTATYLDWDSTAASPCPIVGATWTAAYDGSRVATTDAAGAFTISLASYLSEIDVEQPTAASSCASPAGTYDTPGIAFIEPLLHYAGAHVVLRSFTRARLATFYSAIGAPFDAAKGQLFVHVDGPARSVSISMAHDAVQAFSGTAWSAGDTGVDVFFPNVTLLDPPLTTVTVQGGAQGTGSIPLTAGTITYVTVLTN